MSVIPKGLTTLLSLLERLPGVLVPGEAVFQLELVAHSSIVDPVTGRTSSWDRIWQRRMRTSVEVVLTNVSLSEFTDQCAKQTEVNAEIRWKYETAPDSSSHLLSFHSPSIISVQCSVNRMHSKSS